MHFYKPVWRVFLIAGLLSLSLLAILGPLNLHAQPEPVQYFPETGHTVRGELLDYFNLHGGLRIFGYPITEQFVTNGQTVQYFQRARLELHPESQAPYRVQLGLLGEELGKKTAKVAQIPNSYFQRYYPETGHTVAYAFLNFFDSNGGLDIFGYPISEYGPENGNGRIVQYFQRGKLEWYPELSTDQRVQLADLGSIQFDLLAAQGKLDPALKKPVAAPGQIGNVPLSLKVSATTKYAITSRRFNQTLFVYVTDQKNMPIEGADVSFTMQDATGLKTYVMPKTDNTGFTLYRFDVSTFRPAQTVLINVTATYNGVTGTDQTSFFTWF